MTQAVQETGLRHLFWEILPFIIGNHCHSSNIILLK